MLVQTVGAKAAKASIAVSPARAAISDLGTCGNGMAAGLALKLFFQELGKPVRLGLVHRHKPEASVRCRTAGQGRDEPSGLLLVAYEWKNLLPSCGDCNKYRRHIEGAVEGGEEFGAGKWDRFPVRGDYAFKPDTEEQEHPLLVNPCEDNPDLHFAFWEDGKITAKTEEGEATLKVFELNRREGLSKARARAFRDAKNEFRIYTELVAANHADEERLSRLRLNEMWSAIEPYTAAQRRAVDMMRERHAHLGRIPMPLPAPVANGG